MRRFELMGEDLKELDTFFEEHPHMTESGYKDPFTYMWLEKSYMHYKRGRVHPRDLGAPHPDLYDDEFRNWVFDVKRVVNKEITKNIFTNIWGDV